MARAGSRMTEEKSKGSSNGKVVSKRKGEGHGERARSRARANGKGKEKP